MNPIPLIAVATALVFFGIAEAARPSPITQSLLLVASGAFMLIGIFLLAVPSPLSANYYPAYNVTQVSSGGNTITYYPATNVTSADNTTLPNAYSAGVWAFSIAYFVMCVTLAMLVFVRMGLGGRQEGEK